MQRELPRPTISGKSSTIVNDAVGTRLDVSALLFGPNLSEAPVSVMSARRKLTPDGKGSQRLSSVSDLLRLRGLKSLVPYLNQINSRR